VEEREKRGLYERLLEKHKDRVDAAAAERAAGASRRGGREASAYVQILQCRRPPNDGGCPSLHNLNNPSFSSSPHRNGSSRAR
jgi:hypothetical protein